MFLTYKNIDDLKSIKDFEDNALSEEEYVRGYNEGYLIAKFEPELFEKFNLSGKDIKSDPYLEGISKGKIQYEKEKLLTQMRNDNELKKLHLINKNLQQ